MIRRIIKKKLTTMHEVSSPAKNGTLQPKRSLPLFMVLAGSLVHIFTITTAGRDPFADLLDESQRTLFIKPPTTTTKAAANLAVFYNAYLPSSTNDTTRQNILDAIFAPQLAFLGNSYAVVNRTTTKESTGAGPVEIEPVKLYYNTIDFPLNQTWMTKTCAPYHLEPVHLKHYDQAFEEVTLNALHEYCMEHPDRDVIYLHPKGSFHPKESQEYWRKEGTLRAASEECATSLASAEKCNACGARFHPMPTHFAGNFWRANCDYVRSSLRNVTEVEPLFRQTYTTASTILNMSFTLSKEKEPFLGLERFAAEQWIGSSPAFQPCHHDLYRPRRKSWVDIRDDPVARRREYFLLPGLLLRYATIYNDTAFPPEHSWIYEDFPDGKDYREAVRSQGSLIGVVRNLMGMDTNASTAAAASAVVTTAT